MPTANVERNKKIVLRLIELADAHNFDALDEVLAPDVALHIGEASFNRKQTKMMLRASYEAFPDFIHDVDEIFGVADRVVLRATDRATHRGPFQGIAPTGRRVAAGQISIYRIADGRIVEIWEQFDMYGLMHQLQTAVPH